ncbi:hypothetical protein I2I11_06895 [Pontibacter sp. 172403-2]|uniref:hypothetical protein n=1 Tax=Pontibacter rufus TaxID=2791028 RepID=UPI0018B00DB9|nr:hypothetical protein [Pontibacter sp. 172403-2]MBF9253012.1 hypothetical protein [Pontibacter sp. 172403-2]
MMIYEGIYNDIRASFGKLWSFKERGKSLEIITPFATTSQKFISVFLTEQYGEYIVTDGGWIDAGIYDNTFNLEEESYNKIFLHHLDSYGVKEINGPAETKYFYKKTSTAIAVPSLVFDLSSFICALVSLSDVEFSGKEEKETKERFNKMASDYLLQIIPKGKLEIGSYIDSKKEVRVSALVKATKSQLILINYITGSNLYYFNNSITKANFVFELADKSEVKPYIKKKICLIDDSATGFMPNKTSTYIDHLITNTSSTPINWSSRENILAHLPPELLPPNGGFAA